MLTVLFFIVVIFSPPIFWIYFVRSQDRSEPEPKRLVRRCITVGVVSAIMAAIFELVIGRLAGLQDPSLGEAPSYLTMGVAFSVFLAGPIEELCKYIVLRYSVFFTPDFNQVFDGVVYGISVALGFSVTENMSYFVGLYHTETTAAFVIIVIVRALVTTMVHVTATGILGYYVGRAKFTTGRRWPLILLGLGYAAGLHGVFNVLIGSGRLQLVLSFILVSTVFAMFKHVWNQPHVRMIWRFVPLAAPAPVAEHK